MPAGNRKIHFHFSIMAVILSIMLIMALLTVTLILSVSSHSARNAARELFASAGGLAREQVTARFRIAQDLASTAAAVPDMATPVTGDGTEHPARFFMVEALRNMPELYSIYTGQAAGDFLQIIRTDESGRVAAAHGAPPETDMILRSISTAEGTRTQYWTFLDDTGAVVGSRTEREPLYDPRERPWYDAAVFHRRGRWSVLTEPYIFDSLQEPGVTASRAIITASSEETAIPGVVGVDLTLAALQQFVLEQQRASGTGLAILDGQGRILAAAPAIESILGNGVPAADTGFHQTTGDDGTGDWFLYRDRWQSPEGLEWTVIAAAPTQDFLEPFLLLRRRILVATIVLLVLAIPMISLIARSLTKVLRNLAADSVRVADLDFTEPEVTKSPILEFHQLADSFRHMKSVLAERNRDLQKSLDQLARIIDLNIAISSESDIDRLCEMILEGARELSGADAGSLYLQNEERTHLVFQIVHTESLGFLQGGTSDSPVTLPPVPLFDDQGVPNLNNVVTHTYHAGSTVNIADAYDTTSFDFTGTRIFDEANGYRSQSFLTVPLKPRGSDIIGAMQLINAQDRDTGHIIPFTPATQRFVEALASGAATALYNRDLIEAQKRLFEAMIQLIAGAIDAKSPYTGGHCERVPVLATMLLDEAQAVREGPLADFRFSSEQERRAFRIGAWLHDAGKVTTPDYVVDKAVKLETIYNRIHEVRTRFEVLLRDARIARHETVLNGGDPAAADRVLMETERILGEEFAFIAECNLGGEYISPERLQRLREIGRRRWVRHFDDSLGLSWEEAARLERSRPDAGILSKLPPSIGYHTPVEEELLADKPEHVIPRTAGSSPDYTDYGFALPVPEALYNRGELYNLAIPRGTLTAEERFKINEHVMQTIVMLERMGLPRELKDVPEYAGTHHEALNGTGYPRGLTAEALSIPARIMAIADIFEALTASDRPYKRAKPLSAAVEILFRFKEEGHIDADLFDLFLTSGAYRRYAEVYLRPDQLDHVEIELYLGPPKHQPTELA